MNIYFEAATNTSIDDFLWLVPFFFMGFLVLKYPVFSEVVTEVTKIKRVIVVRIFFGLVVFVTITSIFKYFEKLELQNLIENNQFLQIRGCITDYHVKKPKQGTRVESFNLGDVAFEFSNFDAGPYFHGQNHTDKFLKNGQCVLIDYVRDGAQNKIIKIVQLAKA